MTTEITPDEGKLAQAYVEAMDLVSRCAEALADGDWRYLSDKTGQLRMRVDDLEQAADTAAALSRGADKPRRDVVLAEVMRRGRSYRAVQLLHGQPQTTAGDAQ